MKDNKKVVITYGTFDLFHKGHYNILKRAKELGDYLIVGVTGETYDAERGKLSVRDSLVKRIENVRNTGFADQIIVEEYLGQKIQHIIQYNADVLVVGSDWKGKFDHMSKYCEVKYLERTKDISSTMIRENDSNILRLGIVTSDEKDDDIVIESKYVSGIHAEAVYSPEENLAKAFCDDFELDAFFTDYDAFLNSVDIIYFKCNKSEKYDLIKKALENGKVVLSSPVVANSIEQVKELYEYAHENKNILMECISTFYLQAFMQLLWNAKGNLIGDIVCVKGGIEAGELTAIDRDDLDAHIYFATLVAEKIIGKDLEFTLDKVDCGNGDSYILYTGRNGNSIYSCEIGNKDFISPGLKIVGTEGTINVPEDWWDTGYFEIDRNDETGIKRYSSNFDGNGMRYVIVSALSRINNEHYTDLRLPSNEVVTAIETMNALELLGE